MRTVITSLGGRDVLLALPNYRQYGHLALEILFGFADAREHGVPVCFSVPDSRTRPMLQLQPDGVEVLSPSRLGRTWLHRKIVAEDCAAALSSWRQQISVAVRRETRDAVDDWLAGSALTQGMRRRLKPLQARMKAPLPWEDPRAPKLERSHYYRRRLLRQRLPVRLPADMLAEAERQAAALGIDPTRRIVTAHAREAGYKFGREMQDAKPEVNRDDSTRNVNIDTYFPAFDYLVDRGFTVVRIGDPTMMPISRNGVVDLATAASRTDLLELYCLLRSHFLLGCDSGPAGVIHLTNTPLLSTNCTDPIAAYPIRDDGIYLLKSVVDRRTGRRLDLRNLVEDEYILNSRNSRLYQYLDNTAEEVLEAVKEMLALLEGKAPMTTGQRRYREMVTQTAIRLGPAAPYVRKWGVDGDFLGDGRMSWFCVEKHSESDLHIGR